MPKIHIAITTYKRPQMMKRLMYYIATYSLNQNMSVSVYDDNPKSEVPEYLNILDPNQVSWNINGIHRGKKRFWMTVSDAFQDARLRSWDFFFLLQDDLELEAHFFDQMIDSWHCIEDKQKICLNPLLDESRVGKPNWTGINPVRYYGRRNKWFYRTGWVDCIFMCERRMLRNLDFRIKPIDPIRWINNPKLSSGVGQQISQRLVEKNLHPYQVTESLAHHGDHKSMMNPDERNRNPLIG